MFVELLKWFERLGEKTIVFTHSLENLDILVKMLEAKAATWFSDNHCPRNAKWGWKRDHDYFIIQGTTLQSKRHQMIQSFNDPKNKRCRLFFCSDAGSIGTNMTGGTRVIVFDSKHNPSREIQAIFRSYRIGQTKPVHVYRLIAQGTMEDWILKRQIVKQQTAARVLDNEGITRTIEKNDIDELLRFHPAPKDVDFTIQPDYAPSGDQAFDEFCMSHRDLIVEIRDHDSLIAFNEEEKLAVDVVDGEWENFLRNSHSLQDDVFQLIQEEEARTSLASVDEIIDDNQRPCSSGTYNISPSLPRSSGYPRVKNSSLLSKSSFIRPAIQVQMPPPRHVLRRPFNASTPSQLRAPVRQPQVQMPPPRHVLRRPFNASTPSQLRAPVRQPLRRIDTPRPPIRTITPRMFGSATMSRSARPQARDVKPNIIGPVNRPASRPTLASAVKRPVKRELSPEVICLDDDDENSVKPAKISKSKEPSSSKPKESSSSKRHQHGKK
uniref:Helicase C-terminal domain-containing protein n=1 Tax=Panagrolaimus superbus TaxID=310955 RepID=A0A914Z3S9_9BILA